jgi:Arc/MetJ-type ribon-helix-helix transcriptional regulator
MRRTTITLPDDMARAVDREARRRRTSVSQVVREALASHLRLAGEGDGSRAVPFAALGHSGHGSTARDFEEILDAEWIPDRDR